MDLLHVAFAVTSRENIERFYGDLLGLSRGKAYEAPAQLMKALFGLDQPVEAVVYGNESFQFEFFILPGAPNQRTPDHICLRVEDFEGFLARLRQAGADVIQAPKGDRLITFVKDFDGNMLEIKEV